MRSQHNISPLDSSGSTADSYTSDTTLSAGSPSHHSLSTDIADSGNVLPPPFCTCNTVRLPSPFAPYDEVFASIFSPTCPKGK